jgi:Hint domain
MGRLLATRRRQDAGTPVFVRRGALADNIPHHDLRVTKGHSFLLDDVLIPVEFLVNHRSIRWDDHAREVALPQRPSESSLVRDLKHLSGEGKTSCHRTTPGSGR